MIEIKELTKAYGTKKVLDRLSLTIPEDGILCIMGQSGIGKTTLLNILMGLETADAGTITGLAHRRISAVFQENRLLEQLSPVQNIRLTSPQLSREAILRDLSVILPEEALSRPVSTYSGGMKRRTAIARCMLAASDLLLMDEPFQGLDAENVRLLASYILERRNGRPLLLITHHEEELTLFPQAVVVQM